jgi:uncharacterized protein
VPEDRPDPPAPKPERPRDELGRPLPAGSTSRIALPDFDSMTLDECHQAAIDHFDTGGYFAAHEAWETCWGFAKGTDEEEFFKGLAQLGAGYTHWARGNAHGVVALLGRALERIGLCGSPYRGIDVDAFAALTSEVRERARIAEERGEALGELDEVSVPRA